MSVHQLLESLVLAGQAAAGTSEDAQHADRAGEVAGSLQLADVQALQKLTRSERSATLWAPHSASDVGRWVSQCLIMPQQCLRPELSSHGQCNSGVSEA